MNIASAFVAGDEPVVAVDPRECALDDRPVLPQSLAGFDDTTSYVEGDPATMTGPAAAPMVIGFVHVHRGDVDLHCHMGHQGRSADRRSGSEPQGTCTAQP